MPETKLPWTPIRVDPALTELEIVFEVSDHVSNTRVEVAETTRTVRVSVHALWDPPSGPWFTYRKQERRTVLLDQPLASRRLVGRTVDGRRGPRLS